MINNPFVSIIIPTRNEEKYIRLCLDSVIAQDYPRDKLEILVVDGMSDDATRETLKSYAHEHSHIRLLDNPKIITSCALNFGINASKGELVLWMSAHNSYEKNHVSSCVNNLKKYDADAVGGVIITSPRDKRFMGKAICVASSHSFGVGGSAHKTGTKEAKWVDTAFGVCYKKEVFGKIGLFNEKLTRGQDMEFSLRMKKAGLKTLLAPEIVSTYFTRSDFPSFWKHMFKNGIWAILPMKYTSIMPVSWRHLVPLGFVMSVITTGVLSLFIPVFLLFFLFIIGLYTLLSVFFSATIAARRKDLKYLFSMSFIFASLHMAYGLGSLIGVFKTIPSPQFWRNRFKEKKSENA